MLKMVNLAIDGMLVIVAECAVLADTARYGKALWQCAVLLPAEVSMSCKRGELRRRSRTISAFAATMKFHLTRRA